MTEIITPEMLENGSHCPIGKNGKHKPDINTLSVNHDGDDAYIDVNCGLCGRSGCIGKFDEEQVNW